MSTSELHVAATPLSAYSPIPKDDARRTALTMLFKAAIADAHFRVMGVICKEDGDYPMEKWGSTNLHRWDRQHPYYDSCDEARSLCERLGSFCHTHQVNLAGSPLLHRLHFKETFEEHFEKNRPVTSNELSPQIIHDCVSRRNILRWKDWTFSAGKRDFSTDAYGLDQYIRPLIAKRDGQGEIHELWRAGEPKARAREMYRIATGNAFVGNDGLGDDYPHLFERV